MSLGVTFCHLVLHCVTLFHIVTMCHIVATCFTVCHNVSNCSFGSLCNDFFVPQAREKEKKEKEKKAAEPRAAKEKDKVLGSCLLHLVIAMQ